MLLFAWDERGRMEIAVTYEFVKDSRIGADEFNHYTYDPSKTAERW